MESMRLFKNIQDQNFIQLMDDCFSLSDHFTLTRFNGHPAPEPPTDSKQAALFHAVFAHHNKVLAALKEYRIGTIQATRWFRTFTDTPMYIDLYQASSLSKDTLLSFYDNFFLRPSRHNIVLPADLCFFRYGVSWLASCSHEAICYACPPTPAVASQLLTCGTWHPITDGQIWMIHLDDYEIT